MTLSVVIALLLIAAVLLGGDKPRYP